MSGNPLVHLRGAMGDLLILFPILKSWMNKHNYQTVDMLVSGPLPAGVIREILNMQGDIHVEELIANQTPGSHDYQKFMDFENYYCSRYQKKVRLRLNHIDESGRILKADNIAPSLQRSYRDIKYYPFATGFPIEDYCVISMIGSSNRLWHSEKVLEAWRKIITSLVKHHQNVVLVGQHGSGDEFLKIYPNRLVRDDFYIHRGRLIPYYNSTTLPELLDIMNGADCIFCFDNGVKNLAFLIEEIPTVFLHEPTWPNGKPVEAWYPKELQECNKNIKVTTDGIHKMSNKELNDFIYRRLKESPYDQGNL